MSSSETDCKVKPGSTIVKKNIQIELICTLPCMKTTESNNFPHKYYDSEKKTKKNILKNDVLEFYAKLQGNIMTRYEKLHQLKLLTDYD